MKVHINIIDQLLFKTRHPKMDYYTADKWLIHGTKHHKDNKKMKACNSP